MLSIRSFGPYLCATHHLEDSRFLLVHPFPLTEAYNIQQSLHGQYYPFPISTIKILINFFVVNALASQFHLDLLSALV